MHRFKAIEFYVASMAALAISCLALADWSLAASADWVGLISLVVLGIFSESVAISVTVARSAGYSSITFIPFLASVLLFGPAAGVLVALSTKVIGEFLIHRKRLIKGIFNVSQWVITGTASGAAYVAMSEMLGLEHTALIGMMAGGKILLPFAGLVLVFFLANYVLVAIAITLDQQASLTRVVELLAGPTGANLVYGILISPIAVVVGILYVHLGVVGLFFALLPLIFIRRSYLNNLSLQRANRDLLKALVKAIETRDPYTSGHSLRVSTLARRIAIGMGLPNRRVENIETAALLHDIGKIEATYTDILRKPDSLSEEERQVIESHVTKGVELLDSISSFPSEVIAAVRHHHEREDGKGYPDRIRGDEIPLGAKIIKVCDAVDAMLSDRPYRRALSLSAVKEQLITYAGTQFDVGVVSIVVKNDILDTHRAEVTASKDWSPARVIEHDQHADIPAAASAKAGSRSFLSVVPRRARPSP